MLRAATAVAACDKVCVWLRKQLKGTKYMYMYCIADYCCHLVSADGCYDKSCRLRRSIHDLQSMTT